MDDNLKYMRWLGEMCETSKFDLFHGRTEREEKRMEQVFGIFRELGDLSGRRVEIPDFPPRGP